ncbi:hypothetical protein DPMN_178070 [Dreissena polymorpha]|uniref:Uncharacterized protein n=1 Tax=Dreissena polymorpha TaxID=45954 RepID=A0A9D4ECP6_DREPO|nr:hypothetical protein DPMN_178070 [Dreissena polymorpha]
MSYERRNGTIEIRWWKRKNAENVTNKRAKSENVRSKESVVRREEYTKDIGLPRPVPDDVTPSNGQRKTAPPGCHIYKTNHFTKFHDDWAKNVTSRETNVLTKFHENWAKHVTSRVFTCFHYIHIEKNAPPTGGHVFH